MCLHDMDVTRRADLLAQADAEKLCVDVTHPPSAYRRAFVETIAFGATKLRPNLFEMEDAAMVDRLHAIGESLAVYFDAQ